MAANLLQAALQAAVLIAFQLASSGSPRVGPRLAAALTAARVTAAVFIIDRTFYVLTTPVVVLASVGSRAQPGAGCPTDSASGACGLEAQVTVVLLGVWRALVLQARARARARSPPGPPPWRARAT